MFSADKSAPLIAVQQGKVQEYCGTSVKLPCRLVWEFSPGAAEQLHNWSLDIWINRIFAIIVTIVVALIVRKVVHGLITKITRRMAEGNGVSDRLRARSKTLFEGSSTLINERRRQRSETMGSLLRSISSVIILGSAAISVLGEIGLNPAPFLASAGIVGVAVAFGAQNLVKDFLSGVFMLLEDQYGVGDVIDAGPAKGTVEEVTLRVTKLRDVNGVVWYVRNGTIERVGNESQHWARVVLDVPVAASESLERVEEMLQEAADDLAADEVWASLILEEPAVWGVQELRGEAVVVRVTLKTAPGEQAKVARELRARVKTVFDRSGIAVAALHEK